VVAFFEVLQRQAEPNEFLAEICACLRPRDFIALSVPNREPTLAHTAQQINNKLRSGISRSLAPELPHWFRDKIQEDPEEKLKRNGVRPSLRTRAVQYWGGRNMRLVFR
jgi:hypothetical protein